MFERRPILGILIGLTLCISIWRISVQEPSMYTTELGYSNQLPFEDHRPLPTPSELHQRHRRLYRTNTGRRPPSAGGRTTPQNLDSENLLPSNNLSLISFTPSTDPQSPSPYEYESFPANDFSTLIDFKDFKFLINQPFCPRRSSPYFLILVHSAPTNWEKRQVVRNTWGSVRSPHIHLLFLVGSVSKDTIQQRLERENAEFSDLVQGNFVDDYKNMTYKHVMAMKWFIYFCPEAKYLIKTDDDVFVNTLQLLEYVDLKQQQQQQQPAPAPTAPTRPYHVPKSNSDTCSSDMNDLCRNASHIVATLQPRNFLFCQKEDQSRVKRSFRSKWRVSGREYPNRYYPPYCPGFSIIYSPDVVFRLYKEAQNTKYFWIDDVHITGTLTQLSNITITSFCPWRLHSNTYESLKKTNGDIGQFAFLFAWENTTEEQIRDLWTMIASHYNSTRPSLSGAALPYKYDSFR